MNSISETDKSTLKIAYAIAALNGVIHDNELKAFRTTAEALPGFCAGNSETNSLIVESFSLGNEIIMLKKIYSDEELLKAFMTKTYDDSQIIKKSLNASKKAFAIWIAMMLANHNDSDIERQAIKALKKSFNENLLLKDFFDGMFSVLFNPEKKKELKENRRKLLITNYFLSEIEASLKTIIKIQDQMEQCSDERKEELQKSYNEIISNIQGMINSEE